MKIHVTTLRTVIKQNLSVDLVPLNYAIWSVLENKTNATSYQNIGSLKTAIEEQKNKIPEEFILKACNLFRWRVDTKFEKKKQKKTVAIPITFTVLWLSFNSIVCFFNKWNWSWVIYYYTRICLSFLRYPVDNNWAGIFPIDGSLKGTTHLD